MIWVYSFDMSSQISPCAVGFAAELAHVVLFSPVSGHMVCQVARLVESLAASRASEGKCVVVRLQMTPKSVAASKGSGAFAAWKRFLGQGLGCCILNGIFEGVFLASTGSNLRKINQQCTKKQDISLWYDKE